MLVQPHGGPSERCGKATAVLAKHEVESPKVFTRQRCVNESEIDELGHVSNVDYVRWIQDVARAHSTDVGWDYAAYLELGGVFVVRRHEVDYLRPALLGENVELTTWVESWSAATSIRRTNIVRTSDGLVLARAATTWALVSTTNGRPTRIPERVRTAFAEPSPDPASNTDSASNDESASNTEAG